VNLILSSCEVYKIDFDEWIKIGSLKIARDSPAVCIFDSAFIYVFGGRISSKP
jgi:hypothetical protein